MNKYTYGCIATRNEQINNSSEPYGAILCRSCAGKELRKHTIHEDELIKIFHDAGVPACEDCGRRIGMAAYKRFTKDQQKALQKIENQVDLGTYKACKSCKKVYPLVERLRTSTEQLLITYCSVPCAVNDGMDRTEAKRQRERKVYSCTGCKSFFPREKIVSRQGDFGYTELCAKCAEDPKYFCFFPYADRLRLGLVSNDEIANWNAVHDM